MCSIWMPNLITRHFLPMACTKRRCNRNRRTTCSGHKKYYCLSFHTTIAPDGMIVDRAGAYAGRKNDHQLQDDNSAQPPCVVTIFNIMINSPAQDLSNTRWSPMRVSNETGIGLVNSTWKYCDYYKVLSTSLQPLGIFYRVCNILRMCYNLRTPTSEHIALSSCS